MVHSTLHTNAYYFKVEQKLKLAKNRADAVKALQGIRAALLKGKF